MRISGRSMAFALWLGVAAVAVPVGGALAGGDGAEAIAERKALMSLMPANVMMIKGAIDSKDAKRMEAAAKHAEALAMAGGAIPTMFPANSDSKAGKTAALEAVWSDAAGFKAAAGKLTETATSLAEALKGGDANKAMAAFAAMGKEGCGGCHGAYRAK